ncbi:MAG TPA: Ada metal-binding domain-containing protein [Chitinophagaceae bacterium]|nr:Ada metal-binding domain-containing protein [Chitinophagaceae bacterium]
MIIKHTDISSSALHQKIKNTEVQLAGNHKLYIYGKLSCKSGKRMNKETRVFFTSEEEAIKNGYRPCGLCMKAAYKKWKEHS